MTAPASNPFSPPIRPLRRWAQIAAMILLAGGAVAAILWFRGTEPAPMPEGHQHGAAGSADADQPVFIRPADQQRIGVTFAAVRSGPVLRTVRIVGLVREDETRIRTVTSRLDGFVEQLDADFTGRLVSAGETLLSLYAPEAVTAQTELLLVLDLERSLQAGDPEGRAAARRGVEASRQRLALWNVPADVIAEVERSGTPRRVVPLRTPWGGFVLEKNVALGQRIMAGDPLFRLADLGVIWLEGEVFEQDLALVRTGLHVMATFPALPGRVLRGRVAYIYPTVDLTTRTARIRVEFLNPGFLLKPGMYGALEFDAPISDGVTVPRSAVISTGTRNLVFRKNGDGPFEPREVMLGPSAGDHVQILRGLTVGDTVVASATFLVDAESNLAAMLGGMGGMPGMDMKAPAKDPVPSRAAPKPAPAPLHQH